MKAVAANISDSVLNFDLRLYEEEHLVTFYADR